MDVPKNERPASADMRLNTLRVICMESFYRAFPEMVCFILQKREIPEIKTSNDT
jgi:hypothetical protein